MSSAGSSTPNRARTTNRESRVRDVLAKRQKDLTLVLNNIHDPHNVAAILRSCDAFGIPKVHLLYTSEAFPAMGRRASASARKWVDREHHTQPQQLASHLQNQRMRILATSCSSTALPLPQWDFTSPTAIVLGNEHRGVEPALQPHIDGELFIPMQGMVRSFNVSVAAAIILYEAWRQRSHQGLYAQPSYSAQEMEEIYQTWIQK
ncbi:MAG: TrmH family RNA methyltransferase [Thermodesulfobacteriota bacterium]